MQRGVGKEGGNIEGSRDRRAWGVRVSGGGASQRVCGHIPPPSYIPGVASGHAGIRERGQGCRAPSPSLLQVDAIPDIPPAALNGRTCA
eukprot:scaffold12591_cov102-Isochrysis_galbana.AAC.1